MKQGKVTEEAHKVADKLLHNEVADKVLHNEVADKVLHSDKVFFTFLRSAVSSQAASWVDMGLSFLLFALFRVVPWLSTAAGAVAGGIVNCIINYKFTFHADGVSWRAVAVKYVMVWFGSLLLNAGGTEALYHLFAGWPWLESIGFRPDGYFAAARLLASLIVSWAWNFVLQRNFVYRVSRFDPTAIHIADFVTLKRMRENSSEK